MATPRFGCEPLKIKTCQPREGMKGMGEVIRFTIATRRLRGYSIFRFAGRSSESPEATGGLMSVSSAVRIRFAIVGIFSLLALGFLLSPSHAQPGRPPTFP